MSSQIKNDPMAKFALIAGLALIAFTVLVLLNFLKNTIENNSVKGDIDTQAIIANNIAMIEKNIAPIGEVATGDAPAAAASGARSGEEIYTAVCAACHATGVAEAPKLDDKANWEARVAQGFDGLMTTAINGKGAMPARAGQNIPDNELKSAIIYMTKTAGFDLGVTEDAPAAEAEKAEEAPAAEAAASEEAPAAETPAKEEASAAPESETTEGAPTAPVAAAAPVAAEKPEAPVAAKAPAAVEAPAAPEAEKAVEAPAAPATEEAAEAPKAEEAPAAPEAEKAEEAPAAPAAGHASIDGEAIYKQTCFACHEMGVAGAPKIGDKALWEARIATGAETLYESAIKGKQSPAGVMPPKGGNMSLSDDQVKAAVDYMITKSQ